ncbi:MAG: 30S ribosomal protein S7 [Deltaproteobacteria bacterium]|nr:30S ribosomal protein S7 [Deltaproteobacteria bacterium]
MSRRRDVPIREISPDSRYHDVLVGRFINIIMKRGKKSLAESICYGAFGLMEKQLKQDPLEMFRTALKNVKPMVEVKARRVGGSNYQVPVEVPQRRGYALAMRWIVEASLNRAEHSMKERLAHELMDASKNTGSAIRKRDDVHKMAEANKAFAHYRW